MPRSSFISDSDILNVLHGFNPWWTGGDTSTPSFKRVAYFICLNRLKDTDNKRAVLLSGPRRVGKTTILLQVCKRLVKDGCNPRSILYLSLDHALLRLVNLLDIMKIYSQNVHAESDPAYLLMDEVQHSEAWEFHVKYLVDHRPQYRILATGSATVKQETGIVESGVGRWDRIPIPPLSFYEFMHVSGEAQCHVKDSLRLHHLFGMTQSELAMLAASIRGLVLPFHRYLLVGGFPETARQKNIAVSQRLLREDVVERVLKRDMTSLFGIRNVLDLEKLFIYLCLKTGGIFGVKSCADDLQVSPLTVESHLSALEKVHLIYRLPSHASGGKKVLKARHKVYIVDAALRNAVLLKGERILQDSTEMGMIVETSVLRHLFSYYYRDTPSVTYWRDPKTDKEVDIVVETPGRIVPFEVKYRNSTSISGTDGVAMFCSNREVDRAYVITQREDDIGVTMLDGLATPILKVPAHIFCYLLGQAERYMGKREHGEDE